MPIKTKLKAIPYKDNPPLLARLALNLRQVDVASRAGICIQTVVRAERSGHWPPHKATRDAYQKALLVIV